MVVQAPSDLLRLLSSARDAASCVSLLHVLTLGHLHTSERMTSQADVGTWLKAVSSAADVTGVLRPERRQRGLLSLGS